ncbi:MAG TPA: hypothetical protein VN726_22825 [Hanamia sp.]|nr:hypothetical protein [Hanamia sp.]
MTPLINGVAYSWSSITFNLFGVPVAGIVDINYTRKQTKTNNYGAGQEPVSRGYGKKEYEGSIEIYQDEWKKVISAAPNRDPLSIGWFDIPVKYGNSIADMTQDTLRAVEFLEDPFNAKEGDTKLTVKIPLIIGQIDR